jgi:hypothetical protein
VVGGRPVAQLKGGASVSGGELGRKQGGERARQGRPVFPQIGRLIGSVFLLGLALSDVIKLLLLLDCDE